MFEEYGHAQTMAIWVVYGLFWSNPYGYAHVGPKWDRCRHTHVGLSRIVPDGSHTTALLEKYKFICTRGVPEIRGKIP